MTARITSGFYDYLVVEADCPICKQSVALDCGKGNALYGKNLTKYLDLTCPDCEDAPENGFTLTVALTPGRMERK